MGGTQNFVHGIYRKNTAVPGAYLQIIPRPASFAYSTIYSTEKIAN